MLPHLKLTEHIAKFFEKLQWVDEKVPLDVVDAKAVMEHVVTLHS